MNKLWICKSQTWTLTTHRYVKIGHVKSDMDKLWMCKSQTWTTYRYIKSDTDKPQIFKNLGTDKPKICNKKFDMEKPQIWNEKSDMDKPCKKNPTRTNHRTNLRKNVNYGKATLTNYVKNWVGKHELALIYDHTGYMDTGNPRGARPTKEINNWKNTEETYIQFIRKKYRT